MTWGGGSEDRDEGRKRAVRLRRVVGFGVEEAKTTQPASCIWLRGGFVVVI